MFFFDLASFLLCVFETSLHWGKHGALPLFLLRESPDNGEKSQLQSHQRFVVAVAVSRQLLV